ncbi:MAG: type III-B CRISPR module-associated protein Cmr3 [Calditrichaeota bacterium]|nr:MAG: type III-B CRISPR module-associated protein Cmr3 [Calditrichota bacterium]
MVIKINALDTLFFRDGKPFARGEETWADGLFPPYPSVLYGALRSAYFSEHPNELRLANRDGDPTRAFRITNFYLTVDDHAFFPLPLDLVKKKGAKRDEMLIPLSRKEIEGAVSSCRTPELLYYEGDDPVEVVEDGLLADYELINYLAGKTNDLVYQRISDYLTLEPKVGIGRDITTRTAEEGLLYRVGMQRLSPRREICKTPQTLSLIVAFEGPEIAESGFLRLGGEGKGAVYEQTNEISLSADKFALKNNRFKIVLITPAIFEKGWLPSWLDEDTLSGKKDNISLKLIAGAVGRFRSIGGFDMVNKCPKPMYRAVPAGSVYYFEVQDTTSTVEETEAALIETFHGKPISDYEEMSAQGFGIAILGRLP